MKLILSVLVFLSFTWDLSAAAALAGREPAPVTITKNGEQKSLRATGDNGQTGNMTVAFIPLISIIANFLPRFFNRYATAPPTRVQQARSLSQQMTCQEIEHLGMKWPDSHRSFYYYQCSLSKNCQTAQQARCLEIQHHQCAASEVFDAERLKCLQFIK